VTTYYPQSGAKEHWLLHKDEPDYKAQHTDLLAALASLVAQWKQRADGVRVDQVGRYGAERPVASSAIAQRTNPARPLQRRALLALVHRVAGDGRGRGAALRS